MYVVGLGSSVNSCPANMSADSTRLFPQVPMAPREPAEPPPKKARSAKPAPYDDPECARAHGEFGWAFCESIVFEWKVAETKDLLDDDRWKKAKRYCRNEAE